MSDAGREAAGTPSLARVVGVHGRHCVIELPGGQRLLAHSRGKKSEAVVGDRVRWAPSGDEAVIEAVEPRTSLLKRQDEWRSKNFAANLDLLLVMVAADPPWAEGQLARALVAAADARVPVIVVLNKADLPEVEAARRKLAPYRAMGTTVIEVALRADAAGARALLMPVLERRTTLVLGPSGMGKSTLVNLLVPHADAQVGEISRALRTGRHTTTTTTWYWLDDAHGTALIDSPGFQEFGLHHLEARDLAGLMPDLAVHLGGCRFANCTHRHEPGCQVRAALERGEIAPTRYRIYVDLAEDLERAAARH